MQSTSTVKSVDTMPWISPTPVLATPLASMGFLFLPLRIAILPDRDSRGASSHFSAALFNCRVNLAEVA